VSGVSCLVSRVSLLFGLVFFSSGPLVEPSHYHYRDHDRNNEEKHFVPTVLMGEDWIDRHAVSPVLAPYRDRFAHLP
jgi:hypothetical protein